MQTEHRQAVEDLPCHVTCGFLTCSYSTRQEVKGMARRASVTRCKRLIISRMHAAHISMDSFLYEHFVEHVRAC